jgi:hypothetical protein
MEKVSQWAASYFALITRYYWADQIKENEVSSACGTHRRGEKRVEGFDGQERRKIQLEGPLSRFEDGIKMDLREIGWRLWGGFTWFRVGIVGGLL